MSNIGRDLDFKELEVELKKNILEDERYWRENDAKLRAVAQNVPTYEDFSDMVKAAHLKPIDRADKLEFERQRKGCIWNSFVDKKCAASTEIGKDAKSIPEDLNDNEKVLTRHQLIKKFNLIENNEDIYQIIMKIGVDKLGDMFKIEIPTVVLSKIIEVLLCFKSQVSEIIFICQLLQVLSEANRFNITLDFMSREEKDCCRQLLKMLEESASQDEKCQLERMGVTESTFTELRAKYKVQ